MSECNESRPRLKSPKNRFQLSAGLNLEKLNTILGKTNQAAAQIHLINKMEETKKGRIKGTEIQTAVKIIHQCVRTGCN